jgi:amidase
VPEQFKVCYKYILTHLEHKVISFLLQRNTEQAGYKRKFMEAWSKTASTTSTGRPMDGLICPVAASAGIPHDFPLWWGYTSLFNLIDYPSIVLPLKNMRINAEQDAKDVNYVPKSNPFDVANHDLCRLNPPASRFANC